MNSQEALEAVRKGIYSFASKDMKLEARCMALEALVFGLGEHLGFDRAEMEKKLGDAEALALQTLLEKAEKQDPAAAARLDQRPDVPDLPEETPPQ